MDSRIAKLISSAESHIESKQYDAALAEIAAAEAIEPQNNSIKMIKELVLSLSASAPKASAMKRFFSATVDPKSPTGFTREPAGPVSDLRMRVRSLTSSADFFLSRGNVDSAFESLMRAYLLDPVAPEVLACEQRVLPEWRRVHANDAKTNDSADWQLPTRLQKPKGSSSLFRRLRSGTLFG